jgi:hypothetical protein
VNGLAAAATLAIVAAAAGCKTHEVQDRSWLDAGAEISASGALIPSDAADGARCQVAGGRTTIVGGALVASDGVADGPGPVANGTLFGLLRPNGAAAWAHLDRAGGALTVHDLPGGDPDAPPPELVLRHGSPDQKFLLYSESAARPDGGRTRDDGAPALTLVIAALHGEAVQPVARIPEPRDDSLDADLAFTLAAPGAGLVVWDDDEPFARFGRVRAARVDAHGKVGAGEPLVLTPDGTDAESPQVVATRAGFVVVYRVRRGEDRDAGLIEDAVEAPGERRAFHWLEAVTVPADPALPVSAPRALTALTAHIGAFVVPPEANADDSFELVARDDDAPRDAAGGKLLAIRLAGDLVAPRVLVPAGVGSGALSLVGRPAGAAPFVVYAADDDSARLVPMDVAAGAPAGVARAEPALNGGDPVGLVAGPPGSPPTLVTFSLDPANGLSNRRAGASSLVSVSCH